LRVEEGDDQFLVKPKAISFQAIRRELADDKIEPARYRELKTELWRRFTTAATPLVFVFLGIGLGTMRTRAVRASASLMVFVVIFVYWVLQTAAATLAWKGIFPPAVAMLIPNLILFIPAWISFKKASW
jgi:lipopolysaccharide export LptBFGC system permease protein LptF